MAKSAEDQEKFESGYKKVKEGLLLTFGSSSGNSVELLFTSSKGSDYPKEQIAASKKDST